MSCLARNRNVWMRRDVDNRKKININARYTNKRKHSRDTPIYMVYVWSEIVTICDLTIAVEEERGEIERAVSKEKV